MKGGDVVYADSKGDFCPVRFVELMSNKGEEENDVLERVQVVKVPTHSDLLKAVSRIADMTCVKLVIVDNITFPVMSLLERGSGKEAFSLGCKICHLLHKIAKTQGSIVLVVSNLKVWISLDV